MQQQASAWLRAAGKKFRANRAHFYRLIIFTLVAPIFVTVVPAAPKAEAGVTTLTAPQDVVVTTSGTNITASWGQPTVGASLVTGYQVDYSLDGSTWTTSSNSISPGASTYAITGLISGSSYFIRVAARFSGGLGPWAYPWTKLYGTTNPTRVSSNIVYEPGFGLASAGNQASNAYASASFTRVRYEMQYFSGGGTKFNYVNTDFAKWSQVTGNLYTSGSTYTTPAATISTLAIPDATSTHVIQAPVTDMTVESSDETINDNGLNGRLELWANNYSAVKGASGVSDGSGTTFDQNDQPDAANQTGFGSFQVHNITNTRTIFAWNRHLSSVPDIGIGNSPTNCNATAATDWTYCGGYSTSAASYYNSTNRGNWKLEIFINVPTKVGIPGLIARFDAKQTASYSGSGSTWNDVSGNGSSATLNNGLTTTTVSNGAFNIRTMNFNSASLPANSAATTGKYATLNSPFNVDYSSGITIGFYADFGAANNYERIIDVGSGNANNNILVAREGTTSNLIAEMYSSSGSVGWCRALSAIDASGTWAHFAFVFNGATCTLYKNGALYTSGAVERVSGTVQATSNTGTVAHTGLPSANINRTQAWIGRSNWTGDSYFEGNIADVAVYNRALSFSEVINLREDQIASTVNAASGSCSARVLNPNSVTVTTLGNDCVIKFDAPNNTTTANKWMTPSNVTAARVLVVGGGGGGGSHVGGGGGAGGMIDTTTSISPSSVVSVSTGAGGAGSNQLLSASPTAPGVGTNSSFGQSFIALGGGNGAVWTSYANSTGGSGGGSTASGGSWPTGAASSNSAQGNAGGSSTCTSTYGYPTGGGGGAGGPGENGSCPTNSVGKSGNGGIGKQSNITGSSIYYAGGGGGGGHNQGSYAIFKGNGGLGGGGSGAAWLNGTATTGCSGSTVTAENGTDGLGGGGGGAGAPWSNTCNSYAGRGGSGVVIVRYGTTTLTISPNGGSGFAGTTSFTGSTYSFVSLPGQSGVTRSGYTFTGWNTSSNGSGTNYAPGSVYQLSGTQTLFAQWTSTISYLANGSSDSRTINSTTALGSESSSTLSDGTSSNATIITSGLQLNLDATQSSSYPGSGTTWFDLSGNSRNATASPTAPIFDSANKAFLFNGTNNFFDLGSTNFQFSAKQSYTLAVMVKYKNLYKNGGEACLICRWHDTSGGSYLLRTSAGNLETYRSGDASFNSNKYLPDPYAWNYIAATYNGSSIKLFINGELYSTWDTANGMTASASIKVYLGASVDGSARYFSGLMSAAQIYNIALTPDQLYQNYLALVPDKKTEKFGSTLTGWSTTQDTSTTVITGSFANGLAALPAPYLRLEAGNFNAATKVWTPTNGSTELFTYKGSPTTVTSQNGFGNSRTFTAVSGGTGDGIRFNNIELPSFTFCGLARYKYNGTTTYNTERLFNSVDGTAFFGWHGSKVNRFYIDSTWVSYPKPDVVNRDQDWHYICQTGSNTYWDGALNSTANISTQYFAGANNISLPNMSINFGPSEFSDWEVAEVIIYDQNLSKLQIDYISRYFRNTYGITSGSTVAPSSVMVPSSTYASPGTSSLYARWGSTVTYDPNGASSGSVPATQVFANGTGVLATNTGTLASLGKVFTGWNTAANGTGTFYAPGSTYTGGNILLYAMFVAPVKISNTTPASDPINLNPYMRFKASDYNTSTKTWVDSSGNGRNTSFVRGTPQLVTTTINSNGASKSFTTLQGGINDGIQFKNPQLDNWTMFALSRYNGTNKGRIFVQENNNFLFGTYYGYSGVAHYDSWVTAEADNFGNSTGNNAGSNWVISTGQRKLYRANGNDLTKASPGGDVPFYANLAINSSFTSGGTTYTQNSDWQVSEVILFDRALSTAEMKQIEDYIASTYGISAYTRQTSPSDSLTVTTALGTSGFSDTITAIQGFRNVFSVSPTIPGITLNTSGNSASLTMSSTLAIGTYNETITVTDFNGNTATIPIQLNVVNPLKWSESNTAAVITTAGKSTRTRLDISGGYGTRVATLTQLTSPAPRGISIDTSTISLGYISLLIDTGTAAGTYSISLTVTDGSRALRTLNMSVTVNAPPDITYSASTDAVYPYITSNLVVNLDTGDPLSYSGSGSTWTNQGSAGGNYTLYGTPPFSESFGGVLNFGTNRYADSAQTFSTALTNFTIESWFKLNTLNSSTYPCIVCSSYISNRINFALFLDGTGGKLTGGYHDGTSAWQAKVVVPTNLVTNTWYHVAYTVRFNAALTRYEATLYVNGVAVATANSTIAPTIGANSKYIIGKKWDANEFIDGQIPIVHIYNVALSGTDVRANYANTKVRFLSSSVASPTISGNTSLSVTEGKAYTTQIFTETGGTGTNTYALSGVNNRISLAQSSTTQTSLVISESITATNATTAKVYYETLTATDSTTAATAYYLTITVNPKIVISATTDTVTTTFGKVAYDTLTTTANTGTGTITFTRTSSSGSSAITNTSVVGSPATAVLTISATLPAGTYYETFTATDSLGATSIKVIKIVVNPALSLVALDGTTLTTTISKATSRRIFVYNGSDTRTATFSVTSKDAHSGITLDQSNLQVLSGGYLTVNAGTTVPANTYTYLITVRDVTGSATSISISIVVNKWPTIQNVSSVSDNIRLSYDASVGGSVTNSQWNDLSGNSKNMTLTTGAIVTGESTGLMSFNESTTTTSNGSISHLGSTIDTYSVETWIRISRRPTTEACIFCESSGSNSSKNFYFYIRSSGSIGGNYYNGGWGAQTAEYSTALNTWYHVVFTVFKVGSNYYQDLYINGAKYGSTSAASTVAPATANQAYIVAKSPFATDYAKFSMPLLRLYGRSLTATEVQQNYLANLDRFASASSGTTNLVTTAGAATKSQSFTALNGTGTKTFTRSTSTSGLSISSTSDNTFSLNIDNSLTSLDSQTARTIYETITVTDSTSATSSLAFSITIDPPIIETATTTSLATTSGIETSTVIYATQGTGNKSFTRSGNAGSAVTLTSGLNQATLRVLPTANPGSYQETITATDTAGATTSLVINIVVSPPPSMLGTARIETTQGVQSVSPLYAISGGTGILSLSLSTSPSNSNITLINTSSAGGYIQVGSSTTAGTYISTIRVTDARGSFSEIAVTIVVNAPVTLNGSLNITKTYGDSVANGYSTNGTGTSPFSFSASPVCAVVKTVSGSYTYEKINGTDSCTWTAPVGVSAVDALLVGAGGGGGGDGGGGGGGGSINTLSSVSLPANRQLSVQVGSGGTGGIWGGANATSGGTTSLTSGSTTYTAPGGAGGGGCGSAAAAGGVTGSDGSPTAGGASGFGSTGTGCGAGSGSSGSSGPTSNFTGSSVTYGGGGGGGLYPNDYTVIGPNSGGSGGGGAGVSARAFASHGLITYFRALGSQPSNATVKNTFDSSDPNICGTVTGNINYSTDNDFPCSQKNNFQGYATGYFIAPVTGSITFYLSSDDSSDLVVNGNELQLSTCCTTVNATYSGFVAGQAYPISVYFTEIAGVATWQLYYSYAGVSQTIIPISQFRSNTEGLTQYFRYSSPAADATTKPVFTSGTCAERVGIINYTTDADFPCATKDNFQVYATGYFVAPTTGDITFYLTSDDSSALVLNVNGVNREILRPCCGEGSATFSGFVQGQYYPISLFFTENGGSAVWKLEYQYTGQSRAIISSWYLRSTADFTAPTPGTNGLGGGGGGGSAGLFKIPGAQGGSGTVIIKYLSQSETATETFITAVVNRESPSGLLTLNVPAYVTVGTYTQTIKVRDAANSPPYQATVTITVNKATPTARISLPGGVTTAKYGTPVNIFATTSTPGNVAFKKSGTSLSGCSSVATTNGVASCLWTPSIVETASISVILTPTDSVNFNNSVETASTLSIVVGRADTLTVTAANLTATYSESSGSATTTIPARSFTLTGLASIDSITAMSYDFAGTINGGASYATSASAPTQAGTYTITPKSPVFSTGATTNYVKVDFIAGTLTINRAPRGAWSATYGSGTNTITYGASKSETPTLTFPGDGARLFSTTSTTCSVHASTGVLTTLGVGACDIEVVLAQTNNWLSDTKTVTVTINRGLRIATLTPASVTIKYGDTTSVTSTISPELDAASTTYSSGSSLGCAIDNVTGVVTGTKAAASCSISVLFDQTTLYESATATASITVNKATSPVVTTDSITALSYTGNTAIVTPTYKVTGILARDISQILPLADVSSAASISAISSSSYSTVASYQFYAATPTSYDSTTAPTLGGTYAVKAQNLTLLNNVDIGNYETPTYIASNFVINPIAQASLYIQLSYLESVTVPYDVSVTGGSSSGARSLQILSGGTASGCAVDSAASALRLKTSSPGTCIIQVTQAADRNYLEVISDSQTVTILNFVANILQLFENPSAISINRDVPVAKGPDTCVVDCIPTITAIQDSSGNAMTDMKISLPFKILGTNFNTTSAVLFTATIGGVRKSAIPADSFQIDSDNQITVMPPATFVPNGSDSTSAITVRIYVVASGGQSFPNTSITSISL